MRVAPRYFGARWARPRNRLESRNGVGERAMIAPSVEVVPAARPGWSWALGHWIWGVVHGSGLRVIMFTGDLGDASGRC
jgi:hypothetical protein